MATPKKLAKQRKKGVSPKSASDLAGRLTQAVNDQSISALQATEKPELVFGLVGPIGVDLEPIITAITQSISVAGYEVIPIHLSKLIGEVFDLDTKGKPEDERIELLMRAGTLLRKKSGLGESA